MGVLYDYFAAASDDAAAATIDLVGGPGGAQPSSPELQAAMRAGDREALQRLMSPQVRLGEHGLEVLSVKGIDPVVQLGTLEQLLTGTSTDTVRSRGWSGKVLAGSASERHYSGQTSGEASIVVRLEWDSSAARAGS